MQLDNKKIMIGVGIIAALIIIVVIVAPMLKKAKDDKDDKEAAEDILENSQTISEGGQPTNFVARPYTDRIWDDTQAYFPTKSTYIEINQLSDDDLRKIWQDWHNRYKGRYSNRELRAAIGAAYWGVPSFSAVWYEGAGLVSDRLKAIGLP